MAHEPEGHHRPSIRQPGYVPTQRAAYGVSMVAWFGAIILCLALAHGRGIFNGFALDDFPSLVKNKAVLTTQPGTASLFLDAGTHTNVDYALVYRPLRTLWFRTLHPIFGPTPAGYHVVNLVLHGTVCWLAGLLALYFLPFRAAVAVSLGLACHPLGVEVVASVKAQEDLLCAFFMLTGLLIAMASGGTRGWLGSLLISISYIGALFAKESGAIFPALLLACCYFADPVVPPLRRRPSFKLLAVLGGIFIAYFALRSHALSVGNEGGPGAPKFPWLVWSSMAQVPRFWLMLLWPHRLTIYYADLPFVTPASGLFWFSFPAQVAAVAAVWRTGNRVARLGVVFFYFALLPSLNVLPGVVMFAERSAYVALWGLLVVVVSLVLQYSVRLHVKPLAVGTLGALYLCAMCVTSWRRTGDWHSTETLLRAAIEQSPQVPALQSMLINELINSGKTAEAETMMNRQAAPASPVPVETEMRQLQQRATLLLKLEKYAEAEPILARLSNGPRPTPATLVQYGTALANLGKTAEARQAFERALALKPDHAPANRMLGRLAFEQNALPEARRQFDRSLELEPANPLGWYFALRVRLAEGNEADALELLKKAKAARVDLLPLIRQEPEHWAKASATLREAAGLAPEGSQTGAEERDGPSRRGP